MFILCLFVIYMDKAEGFVTQDSNVLLAQRQQLQFEQEHRTNSLARLMNPSSTLSPDSVRNSVVSQIPTATSSTDTLLTLVGQSLGYGGVDDTSGKTGPSIENTGLLQQKINFCESLPVNCDLNDPKMAECGMCLEGGTNSTGKPWIGGMYISSDDQIRANQDAKTNGGRAKYTPTIGKCNSAYFVVDKETCTARQNQLLCKNTTAPTNDNKCAQCYGSSGPLLYVGAKPKSFNAYLNVSHPGVYPTMKITIGSNATVLQVASSNKPLLDPKQIAITITEGDTIRLEIFGMPKVWCAWLSSVDGKRNVGIDIGEQSISPAQAIGIIGDKRSMRVTRTFSKESGFSNFIATVPNTVMWYARRETMNGIPVSAKYGSSDILSKILAIGGTKNISVPEDLGFTAGKSTQTLVVTKDDGRSHFVTDGSQLKRTLLQNQVTLVLQVPATLDDPYYDMDVEACPSGPIIYTPAGAGMMGSNSCYNGDGSFNPSVFCLQDLFTGAGGTEQGTLYPNDQNGVNAILQKNSGGKPDLEATSAFLSDLGSKANYGTDGTGKPVSMAEYQDASMKMLGTTPKNLCDGPNKDTGPHLPACLDYLWRTSGNPGSDSTDYSFCSAAGKLAPLNPDGSPNERNVSTANDMGSVATIQTYYKSIYDAARDTKDFNKWSASMADCYNANVSEPPFNPSSCDPPPGPGINIVEATYGKNCGVPAGNRTSALKNLANGKESFTYTWDYEATGGDPAGGCGKNIDITYNCSGGPNKTYHVVRPEGEDIDITCSSSRDPTVQGINILDATYGKNCAGSNIGNRTRFFKSLANGKQSLDFNYLYTQTGGDPYPGCPKEMHINYNCNGGPTQSIYIPGESGINSNISMNCMPDAELIAHFLPSEDAKNMENGAPLTTFKDYSGKGNDATMGVGRPPIVVKNAVNNRSVVDVANGSQMNFNLGTSTNKYSIFTVQMAPGSARGWSRLLNGEGSKGKDGYLYYGLGPATTTFLTMLGDGGWQNAESNQPHVTITGKWSQMDLICNGTTSKSSVDGTQQQTVRWPVAPGAINRINIGSDGGGGQAWTGMIAEIMVFNGVVNPAQADKIRAGQRSRWGL